MKIEMDRDKLRQKGCYGRFPEESKLECENCLVFEECEDIERRSAKRIG